MILMLLLRVSMCGCVVVVWVVCVCLFVVGGRMLIVDGRLLVVSCE